MRHQTSDNPSNKSSRNSAMERFVDSQPILNMLSLLAGTGRGNFNERGAWEVCLCALILRIEPSCKVVRILEALPYGHDAMDEADLLNTMAHMGYFCRPAECDMNDIDERLLPGLFIPSDGTPCIILGRDGDDHLQFYDPLSKLISNVPPCLDKDGKIWFFQNFDENRSTTSRFMRKGSGYTWFRAMLGRFDGTLTQVLTAGLILNIIALATPLFIMLVYDRVIAAGAAETLPMLAVGALLAIGFEWVLRHIRSTGLSWMAGRMDNIVSNRIFAHLIGLSPDLIERASVPAQIARIKTFESVRDFFSGSAFLSLLEAPYVVISVAAVALIAGPLVLVPLLMVACYIGLFYAVRAGVKQSIRLAAKASSARQQFTIETFEKLDGIRGQGLTSKWQEKFRHLSGREMMAHFRLGWLGMVAETGAHTLTVISGVATVAVGVHLIWAGAMSTGALVAAMILVWRILTPFYSLCTMIPRLEQLRNSIIQVNDLMEIKTEAEEARSFSRLSAIKGNISFHDVAFRHEESADDLFRGLSFNARAGDLVVVVGGSGAGGNSSGKAMILKLVQSLYRATAGTVRIDGFDIRQLDAADLRHQIAYVPAVPHVFQGSIVENLRLSNPLASDEDVRKALERADMWDDVQNMPNGMNTVIGSLASMKLTSGMASRLSLARAYLQPSSILLIDDLPNALLSGRTGQNLKDYLAQVKGRQTVIVCSYREDYMQMADTLVWLGNPAAPQSGPKDTMFDKITSSLAGEAA